MPTFRDALPRVYKENKGASYLFGAADTVALSLTDKVNSLVKFLDPALTTDAGLNFIAREILDLRSWFWSDSWKTEWKRKTIQNYSKLIQERGNKSLISWLFTLYGLNVRTKQTGWILDVSPFPVTFGVAWDQLIIVIPPSYVSNTPEYKLVQDIVKWFIPDLITVTFEIGT
jgi:hypothetical protein